MNDLLDLLLSADPGELFSLIAQIIADPLSDLRATLLLLVAIVVLTLLAILLAILFIGFRGGEESRGASRPQRTLPRAPKHITKEPRRLARRMSPAGRRHRTIAATLVTLGALAAAWLLAGVTTGADAMCLSCHTGATPHAERFAEGSMDPHATVACVRCHEPGGAIASLTTNVPLRAAHFADGIVRPGAVTSYGTPAPGSGCESCHSDVGREVITVEGQGVRISHREPLEAGAICSDCHEIQAVSGVVGAWTVGMSPCLRCHDNRLASAECSACHTKDVAYAMHVNRTPAPKRLVPETRCGSCHDQRSCDACHGIRMPHTSAFVNSEHPRAATLDLWRNQGRTCGRCHTDERNSCTKCHPDPFPGHATNAWPSLHGAGGAGGSESCDNCHGSKARIAGRNFCGVCHEEYVNVR